jgi:phage-related protein
MYKRIIRFYNHHFNEFYLAQTEKVRKKILQTLIWIETLDVIPVTILRSIEGVKGLYEIRVEFSSNIFRIFCCFDEGSLVVLFNGFQKKTQKTPPNEIERAERLMKEYFDSKTEKNEKRE